MTLMNHLPPGCWVIGRTIYCQCARCNKVVRVNKPIIGSMHLCAMNDTRRFQDPWPAADIPAFEAHADTNGWTGAHDAPHK